MKKVEEKRVDVSTAVSMGEVILAACHPDCVTIIKHWITIIRARFEEVGSGFRGRPQVSRPPLTLNSSAGVRLSAF